MKKSTAFARLGTLMLTGALALGASACEDDPTEPDHDDLDPVSVRLMLGDEEIASASHVGDGTVTGEVQVDVGGETGPIAVEFLDEEGDVIDFDDDYSLEVVVGNASIADFEQDAPGEFGGVAQGIAPGSTTFTFRLLHGSHSDFDSAPVPVEVANVEGNEEG